MIPEFLRHELPVIAAPMAGGTTTPGLVAAASDAGALAFVAAGYKTPEALAAEIAAAREAGARFGVNLFVPDGAATDREAFRRYAEEIAPEAAAYGLALDPDPVCDDDAWDEKIELLCADPVPLVSLTFGLPAARDIARLRRAGSAVLATVTTPAEARAAADSGVDGLIAQGPAAGGHSGTWDPDREILDAPTAGVLAAVLAETGLPVVAAGGVDGPAAVAELLAGGAAAVAVGTLLLRTDEAGTSETHRDALASGAFRETAITRAFTGRPARALRNGFLDRHDAHAITGYPAVHHLTRELRRAAAVAGDADRVHLWAGTGYRAARTGPVADTLRALVP